ncbi:hypothetical protein [Candidatus Methylacidiphilum infernorum]|uniref:Uncharacterized protein n=1 Tax=Methylacidiphilum infernorum (isolate V4) TaxID=481448 RepID=B3DV84_METI4|nr:hypothetical protein [Candidatus Methylacidiphilum infernorum]ACD83237.1 Hypothetical protein Minf_1182 [Methylacidiphilum infernorum V4]
MNNPQIHLEATKGMPPSLIYAHFLSPHFHSLNLPQPASLPFPSSFRGISKALPVILGLGAGYGAHALLSKSKAKNPLDVVEEFKGGPHSFLSPEREKLYSQGIILPTTEEGKRQRTEATGRVQNKEMISKPDPFLLRALKTITRFGGSRYSGLLGMEIAGPSVYASMQSLAQGKTGEALVDLTEGALKGSLAIGVGKISEKLGEHIFGGIPLIGKPTGRWIGWVIGSSMGERIGGKLEAILDRLKAPPENMENLKNTESFLTQMQNFQYKEPQVAYFNRENQDRSYLKASPFPLQSYYKKEELAR